MTIQGGCLCGGVRYEIDGELFAASHCHCSMCRRQHGAAFSSYANFAPEDLRWVSGRHLLKVYETPAGAGWCFCTECGSSLAATDNGTFTSVTLGTVEGDPRIRPRLHMFVGSKAPWHALDDALPKYDEWPPAAPETRGTAR